MISVGIAKKRVIHSEVPMPTLYHTKRRDVISSINICFVVMFIAINVVDLTWLGSSLYTIEANVVAILAVVTAGFWPRLGAPHAYYQYQNGDY